MADKTNGRIAAGSSKKIGAAALIRQSGCIFDIEPLLLIVDSATKQLRERQRKRQQTQQQSKCVPRLFARKVHSSGRWKVGIESHRLVLKDHDASRENSGKERSIAGNHSQVRATGAKSMVPHSTTERKTKPKKEAVRPQRRLGIGQGCVKLKKSSSKDTFYSLGKAWVVPAPCSTKPEERHFVIDSGASMHMLSKKDLWSQNWRLSRDLGLP